MLHYYVYFNIDIFLLKGQWGYKYYILYFDVFKKYIIKMFSSSKKNDTLSSLPWRLFKRTGLFVVGQIPAAMQMAVGALIFRQIIKANRLQTLGDMENLRKQVINVDVKVRDRLLRDVSLKIKPLVEDMIQPLLDEYFNNVKHLQKMALIIDGLKKRLDDGDVKVHLIDDDGELQELMKSIDGELTTHIAKREFNERERELVVSRWTDSLSDLASAEIVKDILAQDLGLNTDQASALDMINERVFKAKGNREKLDICKDLALEIERSSNDIANFCSESWNERMDGIDDSIRRMTGIRSKLFGGFKNMIGVGFFERLITKNSQFISLVAVQYIADLQFLSLAFDNGVGIPSHAIANGFESWPAYDHHHQLQLLPSEARDDVSRPAHARHVVAPELGE